MFSNKEENIDLSFSVEKKLISRFEHSHQTLGFQREWNRIAIVLISVCSVNKCDPFSTFWCCVANECCVLLRWSRSILLVCDFPKGVCFLKGSRSLLWWFVYCNLVWLLSGLPSSFLGTGCSSWLKSEPV